MLEPLSVYFGGGRSVWTESKGDGTLSSGFYSSIVHTSVPRPPLGVFPDPVVKCTLELPPIRISIESRLLSVFDIMTWGFNKVMKVSEGSRSGWNLVRLCYFCQCFERCTVRPVSHEEKNRDFRVSTAKKESFRKG